MEDSAQQSTASLYKYNFQLLYNAMEPPAKKRKAEPVMSPAQQISHAIQPWLNEAKQAVEAAG